MNRRALVRRPSPRLAEGLLTHLERVPVDVDLALRQWDGYVAALRAEGWEVVEVPPSPDCPDSVFVEDTVVMYADLAVITRPGADDRRPETAGTEQVLRELGYRIAHIEAPGTLEGGDVLKHDGTVCVGRGGPHEPGRDRPARGPPRAAGRAGGRRTADQGPAPQVRRHRAARRHRRRLRGGRRRSVGLWSVRPRSRGVRLARRAARRPHGPTSAGAPSTRRIYEERGLRVVAVDIDGVREARGLRHLPVRAACAADRGPQYRSVPRSRQGRPSGSWRRPQRHPGPDPGEAGTATRSSPPQPPGRSRPRLPAGVPRLESGGVAA